jgi:hypothetical protein
MTIPDEAVPLLETTANCGVYFLSLAGQVVYVGQSQAIKTRIGAHRKRIAFDQVHVIAAHYETLNELEDKWINQLRPPLNKVLRNVRLRAEAMERKTFFFAEEMAQDLRAKSAHTGIPVSEIVRRALVEYIAKQGA